MRSSPHTCHHCGQSLAAATYRIVGIERDTWRSVYACSTACEAHVRGVHSAGLPPTPDARLHPLSLPERAA